jgi:V8-like Glu-specific endopeptidase
VELTGGQWQQLSDALRSAFDYNRLQRLLQFRLEKSLQNITLADSLEQVVFDVIELSQAEGWTVDLVSAGRDSVPGNVKLFAFAQQLGLVSTDAPRQSLEQTIVKTNSYLDVDKWRSNLGRVEPCVCRVEVKVQGGMTYGTGFLVAPTLVMTNYHVAEAVIMGDERKTTASGLSATPDDVVLRFDYKRTSGGDVVNEGVEYRLAGKWLETSSPLSPSDLSAAGDAVPTKDELDFVLLRLKEPAGNEPIGGRGEPGAATRGWIEVPTADHDFLADSPLFILQHPQGTPLKLALDTEAVVSVNANGTRVLYRTNTEPGSSGSPCFDQNWQLVALHHSGDPNFDGIKPPQHNRGIPIAAIRQLLEVRELAGELGPQEP